MTRFWRNMSLTAVTLFLEGCVFYMLFSVVTALLQLPDARVPFYLALLTLAWSYALSLYLQTTRFSLNLKGALGLGASLISLVMISNIMTGSGWIPMSAIVTRDLTAAATVVVGFASLVVLWWRGAGVAQDEVSLDTIRGIFQWGMAVVFGAVLIDAISSQDIVNGFLVLGFFAAGLVGLSMARFASEAGDSQAMSKDWLIPIGVTVGGVLALVLLLSLLGMGGLDDVTRGLFRMIGTAGLWVLKPVLLGLGYIAAALAMFINWLASMFGGGDLSSLDDAQRQIQEFHDSLRENELQGPPALLVALLKWGAFLIASAIVGWVLFRLFRFRRFLRSHGDVEETRESLFSWERANQDLVSIIGGWWNNLVRAAGGDSQKRPEPTNPREVYHSFLALSGEIGHPKPEEQTPREHQSVVTPPLPERPVSNIVDGFQSAHYGGQDAGEAQMQGLLRDWSGLNQYVTEMQKPAETSPGGAPGEDRPNEPPGNIPPGEVPPGNIPPGEVPPGNIPPGEVPPGNIPPGDIPPR